MIIFSGLENKWAVKNVMDDTSSGASVAEKVAKDGSPFLHTSTRTVRTGPRQPRRTSSPASRVAPPILPTFADNVDALNGLPSNSYGRSHYVSPIFS